MENEIVAHGAGVVAGAERRARRAGRARPADLRPRGRRDSSERGRHAAATLSRAAGEPLAATATTTERLAPGRGSWAPGRATSPSAGTPARARTRGRRGLARAHAAVAPALHPQAGAARPSRSVVRRPSGGGGGGDPPDRARRATTDLADADLDADGELVATDRSFSSAGTGAATAAARSVAPPCTGALAGRLGDDELWISSHQGGHRFAANVLVLPRGLQLGRLIPRTRFRHAVARALAGRIELDHYRGRTCYDAAGPGGRARGAARR